MKFKKITNLPKTLLSIFRTKIGNLGYSYTSKLDKNAEAIFLNYGYADNNENNEKLRLRKEDENNRYCIQLYNHVITSIPIELKGLNICEVGCGRGGGISYLARYFNPGSVTGLDLCKKAVKFSKKHYSNEKLSFVYGDALNLPFQDNSFDVVINVESSLHYTDINKFFLEVNRVLKQGGYFSFADFRKKNLFNPLKEQLNNSGLKIVKEAMITSNIVQALDLDSERRLNLIKRLVPKFLHKLAMKLAGVKGTDVYQSFITREREYFNFVLQKIKQAI